MAEIIKPFEFRQCLSSLKATGKKAGNLQELKNVIAAISDECLLPEVLRPTIPKERLS